MKVAKDGIRSIVRIGYDGSVHKTFRGTDSDKRFANEVRILKVLEQRGCTYVPRLIDSIEETLTIITTNCGKPVESLSERKTKQIFADLQEEFGVIHDDPFDRNITYDQRLGRFCVIDFELAEVIDFPDKDTSAGLSLSWYGESRDGRRKPGNEDAQLVFSALDGVAENRENEGFAILAENGVVVAVSDGMGGPGGGNVASSLAVGELRRFLPAKMGRFKGIGRPLELMEQAIQELHLHVDRLARSGVGVLEMGATLVCSLFLSREMHFAHVGDSRIYLFRDGEMKLLTTDQTMVGNLFLSGKINERESRNHPRRNILMQAIAGGCRNVIPQVGTVNLEPGDWFLFCSDGVIDGLWDKHIQWAFEEATQKGMTPKEVTQGILDKAMEEAGMDDTTAYVVSVESASPA